MPKSPNFPGLADRSIARLACPCFSAANLCGTKVSHALSSISVHAMKISDFATVVRSFNCDFVERCRFRTQQEATYLEKRLRIRPLGVVSKNDMGLRKIAYAILSCSFRDAYDDSPQSASGLAATTTPLHKRFTMCRRAASHSGSHMHIGERARGPQCRVGAAAADLECCTIR